MLVARTTAISPPRVFSVLAAAALLATVLPGAASASAVPSYVALGDSYTSGPLIPDQTGNPAGCLRSTHDYPALVAAAPGAASFSNVSCVGVTTADMTGPQQVALGTNPPQLNALPASTTLVTLGIGGNDIGFANVVISCTSLSLTSPFGSPCKNHYTAGGTDQLALAISQTAPKVAAVLAAIHHKAPSARVLVVGYPVVLPGTGHGCWPTRSGRKPWPSRCWQLPADHPRDWPGGRPRPPGTRGNASGSALSGGIAVPACQGVAPKLASMSLTGPNFS